MKRVLAFLLLLVILTGVAATTAFVVMEATLRKDEVVVPNLMGLDVITALETLEKNDLNLKISGREYSNSISKNFIISQKPHPKKVVKKDRNVRVVISNGSKEVLVPDLRGRSIRQVENILRGLGLQEGNVAYVRSPAYAENVVMEQNPKSNSRVLRDSSVSLLVSRGSPNEGIYMPDLIGTNVADAGRTIEVLNLKLGKITYEKYAGFPSDVVIRQSPPFGYRIHKGRNIDLVLSKQELSGEEKKDTFGLLNFQVPEGDTPLPVKIIVENAIRSRQVFNEMREPGSTVSLLIKIEGDTIARIYVDETLLEEKRF